MKLRINLIKYFANLKFAINILILIASLSILGTIIEQEQTITFYKENYSQKIIQYIDLEVYYTTWSRSHISNGMVYIYTWTICSQFKLLHISSTISYINKGTKIFFLSKKINYEKLDLNGQVRYTSNGNLITQLK